jgi:diacylglycerol kinase (ATP)
MKNRSFSERLGFAVKGIRAAWSSESSFRIQTGGAVASIVLLLVLRPAPMWWAIVFLTSSSVLAAELVNTALESVVDRLHPEVDPAIGRAKDCAAGAVLVLSLASLGVAGALVYASVRGL